MCFVETFTIYCYFECIWMHAWYYSSCSRIYFATICSHEGKCAVVFLPLDQYIRGENVDWVDLLAQISSLSAGGFWGFALHPGFNKPPAGPIKKAFTFNRHKIISNICPFSGAQSAYKCPRSRKVNIFRHFLLLFPPFSEKRRSIGSSAGSRTSWQAFILHQSHKWMNRLFSDCSKSLPGVEDGPWGGFGP